MAKKLAVYLCTCATDKEARTLARQMLVARAAACVNIIKGVESHYRWQGKLEKATEQLLLIKSSHAQQKIIEKIINRYHSYDVPELIELKIAGGRKDYLNWLEKCL